MGKGVILKGKAKENIYPVSSSDLVFDPTTKKSVKADLGTKVEEAPKDDKQYARINGAWAEVEAGAVSETVLITLTPANTDLYGVSVRVTTNEGDTILDTTWQGAQLSVQVRAGLQYTVAVGDKDGYITPESVTYTAVKGASRSVNMAYVASKLTVNILSNQANDTAISGVKATVTYGSTSVQVANGGSVDLPLNTSVKITFPAVAGYKTPDAITYDHTSGNYEKSGTYQTEVVKVTLSADSGASVSGQVVTINGTQYTWNGTAISQKVAFGTTYSVSVNDLNGFTSPSAQTFTAGQATRSVSMVYEKSPYGVFIEGVSGKLYDIDSWKGQEKANSIALVYDYTGTVMTSFASIEEDFNKKWGDENLVSNYYGTTTSKNEAYGYPYNGESLTTSLINALGDTAEAATYCNNYTFQDGSKGYLPTGLELQTIYDNKDEFNRAINKVMEYDEDYAFIGSHFNGGWTCLQCNASNAWYFSKTYNSIDFQSKTTTGTVRSFKRQNS